MLYTRLDRRSPHPAAIVLLALLTFGIRPVGAQPPTAPHGENEHLSGSYAVATYGDAMVATLADLVAFPTVHVEGQANADQPSFKKMTAYLRGKAESLGFDFTDGGAAVVIGMGQGEKRLGLLTHGDVQPADPSKWVADPFSLDTRSHPGRLVARGSEDDKGPIAAALYAMKAVHELGTPLERRVELIVAYTEESDWTPFMDYLASNPPPDLNVALDAQYPVVVAEKGFVALEIQIRPADKKPQGAPSLASFEGGSFLAQVPEDASAEIAGASEAIEARLRAAAEADEDVEYSFERTEKGLVVRARGRSAHSAAPWNGVNAVTHLAEVLASIPWTPSSAAQAVRFIHDLVGTGYRGEQFGAIAHEDPFMGPLTLSLGTLRQQGDTTTLGINIRRPVGKDADTLEREIRKAVADWGRQAGTPVEVSQLLIYEPHDARDAPHVPILLEIFREHTGQRDAAPISMGGGTHARLVPHGVNFGPNLPGRPYMGHAEGEYIEREDLLMSLAMYTTMIERLAGGR